VLARAVAGLDLLSGGRIELGLGAGAYWDPIAAMGGQRLRAGEAVQALEEAIAVLRQLWDVSGQGGARVDGQFHSVRGAKRGPAPAHPVGIWLGAYKPRMLELTGRLADGWLPTAGYLGPGDLAAGNAAVDAAATAAGRDPAAVRRLLNISPDDGPSGRWAQALAALALEHGTSAFILGSDDPETLRRYAGEVAPAVRELVAAARTPDRPPAPKEATTSVAATVRRGAFTVVPTPDDGTRRSGARPWDETTRPADVAAARSRINEMTMRQNKWTAGAYCESYCRVVTVHHTLEDTSMFPHLRGRDPRLGPVLDRLAEEHRTIHEVLEGLDHALVSYVAGPGGTADLRAAVDLLSDTLLSHLAYEERELVEPSRVSGWADSVA
jgi:alkanesulfonate monooxygenase SsuD/methylene tetrahydromethanopterin reductase-like flavin-dependent oxidoreductase (luciferase family)